MVTSRILLATGILCSSLAGAEPPGPPVPPTPFPPPPESARRPLDQLLSPGPGIPPQLAQRLGIPEEKLKQIRAAGFEANDQLISLEANLKRSQLALDRLLAEPSPEEKQVVQRLEEVGRAEVAVRKNRVLLLLQIRKLLGSELWQKLEAEAPPFEPELTDRRIAVAVGGRASVHVPGLARVAVGDPEVAEIKVAHDEILLNGRREGRTTVLAWSGNGARHSYVVEVRPPQPGK